MSKFQPFQYIKKYAVEIIVFLILLTVGLYIVLRQIQTYTAEMVIEYVYSGAENGLAPDGTDLDAGGIYSSNIISQVMDNLELDPGRYSLDQIRAAVVVEEIADESVDTVNEALNMEGESSDLQSTKYSVTYRVDSADGADMARAILDEIIDVYFTEFSKQYINTSSVINSTSDINASSYDYIEQMELIESALERTINNLSNRATADPEFYSSETGYSFNELVTKFSILQNTQVDSLYSYILNHRVTKDLDVLLAKYEERVQTYELAQESNRVRMEEVEQILDAYVEKLRESDNTAKSSVEANGVLIQDSNVLGEVVDPYYTAQDGTVMSMDQTTEYEILLQNWIDISDAYDASVIDAAYAQYVIDCFSGSGEAVIDYQTDMAQSVNSAQTDTDSERDSEDEANSEDDADSNGENTAVPDSHGDAFLDLYTKTTTACTQEDIDYVEERIDQIISTMNELYLVTADTDAEYNEYLGAEYIRILSGNQVTEGINLVLYTLLGAVLFLVIGCTAVIVLGRLGDVIEYTAYIDHQYHMANRAACDRYIRKYENRILPSGFGCMFLQTLNQNEINQKLGRKGGDEALSYLATSLKNLLEGENAFVGYNGSGQFMIFLQSKKDDVLEKIRRNLHIMLNEHFRNLHIGFQYAAGIAVSSQEEIYQIRALLGKASGNRQQYEAGAPAEEAGNEEGK